MAYSQSKRLALLITIVGSLMALQLIDCSEQAGTGNGGDEASAAITNGRASKESAAAEAAPQGAAAPSGSMAASSSTWGLPVLVVQQKPPNASATTRQGNDNSKPDFFLIWLKPYEQFIPGQIMDAINSNLRPQTEQVTGQVMSQVPGADEYWSQLSGFMNTLSNMGGAQSFLNGFTSSDGGMNPIGGLMQGLGRRPRTDSSA